MQRRLEGWSSSLGARGCALLLAAVALALPLGAEALFTSSVPSFAAARSYPTGTSPTSVAIGDLNGDGKPELATANFLAHTVSVLLNTPGLCTVQDVFRQTLPVAKRTIARANCRVGKIRRAYSKVKRGRVISQKPKPGTVLPSRGKVNLVVSRGRKH
jgi:hypothetical protein